MLGDIIIPIIVVGYVAATIYISVDERRRREQQKEVDYDELMRMIEKHRAELGPSCSPDTEKITDKI